MTSGPDQASPRAIVALAFALVFFAACGDGGSESDAAAAPVAPSTAPPVAAPAAQPGVFRSLTTWAGSPDPGGADYRDGTGSAARFDRPAAVAVASDGSLWVSEPEAQRIRRIDGQGRVTTVLDAAALAPRTDAQGRTVTSSHPGVMVAAPSGGVFVAMQQSTRAETGGADIRWAVLRIAPGVEPQLVTVLAAGARVRDTVTGLALDRQGRLWVSDMSCALWRTDGEVLATRQPRSVSMVHASGSDCESWLNLITGLAIDAEDRVLFTLSGRDVRRLEPDLRVTSLGRTSGGPSFGCNGLALDREGGLLIGGESALLRMDGNGQEQLVAGSQQERGWFDGPAASARFYSVCGVTVDHEGRTVLIDRGNHTVRRIERDGSVSTIAGLAPQEGHREGTGPEAHFRKFFRVGPGLGGDVVVADPLSGAVRGVDAQQRSSTLAGIPSDRPDFNPADGPVATATFYRPTTALKTADGSLWIGDGNRLRRLGPDGMVRTLARRQGGEGQAFALALDRTGDVVVAWGDTLESISSPVREFHHFERYSASAPQAAPVRLDTVVPDELAKALSYWLPRGLCFLADGTLVYTQGPVVLRRAADGAVALLAGSPNARGHQDGPATDARFMEPSGLACDAEGGIYVADSGNHTVRYIDAQRNVRTVLGTPGRAGHRVGALPGELHTPRSLTLVPGGLVVATGQGLVRAGF
jgi:DNA-binding beta-propeller fold protein YncE